MSIAADWVKVIDDNDASVYVDTHSIKLNGSVVTCWTKWEFKKIQIKKGLEPFKVTLMYTHIDCKEKIWGVTRVVSYDEDGKVVDSLVAPLQIKPIPPDSRIEYISYVMCLQYHSNNQ